MIEIIIRQVKCHESIYGSLKRMLDAGLVEESDKRVDPEMDDKRRIYDRMTEVGRKALAAELERYRRIVTLAQERKLLTPNKPGLVWLLVGDIRRNSHRDRQGTCIINKARAAVDAARA